MLLFVVLRGKPHLHSCPFRIFVKKYEVELLACIPSFAAFLLVFSLSVPYILRVYMQGVGRDLVGSG